MSQIGDYANLVKAQRFISDRDPDPEITVGQILDGEIFAARKRVEDLCIKKAKAEALNMLDFPADFVRELIPTPY